MPWFLLVLLLVVLSACARPKEVSGEVDQGSTQASGDQLSVDPKTGVPYAKTFQFPIQGFNASDFGFGFGSINDHFCLAWANGSCSAFGAHLGRDSQVKKTPVGTPVLAPADGIVRISTDEVFGGYGSDSVKNSAYKGCLILIEHEFPNGQQVLSLLGHVQCESGISYQPETQTGNPPVGTLVKRGQYVARVAHYWSGSGTSIDWHHLHWAMRVGPYQSSIKSSFVAGYDVSQHFSVDPVTHAKTHATWMDPFVVVAANGDPEAVAASGVRHHPSGSLLLDPEDDVYLVVDEQTLSRVPASVLASDRYDVAKAIRVSVEELDCYGLTTDTVSVGGVQVYKHAGSPAVAIAQTATFSRQDFVRWEALLSWGYSTEDIQTDPATVLGYDAMFSPNGLRRLRPGSLVKADEHSEVCVVRMDGKRQPIASAEVFEALGYAWEDVYSIPQEVLDAVAGERVSQLIDWDSIHACVYSPLCEPAGSCGGGGSMDPSQNPVCTGECTAGVSEMCLACPGVSGIRTCSTQTCTWSACQKPSVQEVCSDGIDNDCNGVVDCQDPMCAAQVVCQLGSFGGGGSSGTGAAGSTSGVSDSYLLHFHYVGPSMPGTIVLNAWWQPPMDIPRPWGPVTECADQFPNDGVLDCTLKFPHGTKTLEFQLDLPNGAYWGDTSCYLKGGCGTTNGTVSLSNVESGEAVVYQLIPNVPGEPYLKGHVAVLP